MRAKSSSLVSELLNGHSEVRQVLGWYGIQVDSNNKRLTLEAICKKNDLDVDDVLIDLQAVMNDDEDGDEDDDEDEGWAEGADDDDDEGWE